jgi:hypothetical protein
MEATMATRSHQDQIEHEAARVRELALKSGDPLLAAKAIAVSDEKVQGLIAAKLEHGGKLIETVAYPAPGRREIHIFFRFDEAGGAVHFVDRGVLVIVDKPSGRVVGTIDPYELQPERRSGHPFAHASRDAWDHRTEGAGDEGQDQLRAYFVTRKFMLTPPQFSGDRKSFESWR